jgi:hypothetical protein
MGHTAFLSRFTAGLLCLTLCGLSLPLTAQNGPEISGVVRDEQSLPLAGALIRQINGTGAVYTTREGTFRMSVPAGKITLVCSFMGYQNDTATLEVSAANTPSLTFRLTPQPRVLDEVVVQTRLDRAEALRQIDLRTVSKLPLPAGHFEAILTTLGASSRNEMGSEYSVRGGNFDENLVYVNDIEIYRPLTVKAGQQEGLSFLNTDLVSSVQFAAGGFDARYGDKMSSVLDIRYKRPDTLGGSVTAGLLGASAHAGGCSANKRFTAIAGVRYKSNQYLLNTLETKGDYKPSFFDFQSYLTYRISDVLDISILAHASRNNYKVIPHSRQTAFGTYQQALGFVVYYEGQEVDRFTNLMGAFTLNYRPTEKLSLKFIGSGYTAAEAVTYDILGQYRIDLLDNTVGSETAGDSILNIGVGGMLSHARNYADARILNFTHKGNWQPGRFNLQWGLSVQSENLEYKQREWEMIDSAGYSVPFSDEEIRLSYAADAHHKLNAIRYSGYLQQVGEVSLGSSTLFINAGVRFLYRDLNNQWAVSPRTRFTLEPASFPGLSFHLSVGWYHQPPFFKEMIDPLGNLYRDVQNQKSVHYVLGTGYNFSLWKRPFRFTTELYYKNLSHLVPYTINDVDIRYLPAWQAKGYAAGIEFKLNGEFVKGAESWATLSFLSTREDRINDAYGSYPRPTDQRVNFGMYFQDYVPSNPSYRVYTLVFYGSRLPYGSPDYNNPEEYYHLRAYKRIDIGLSKSLLTDRNGNRKGNWLFIKDAWFSLEVFNLFGFNNQASYQWIRTVSNQEGFPNMFAVPNFLSGRLFNVKLSLDF